MHLWQSKLKAFLIHLLLSVVVILIFLWIVTEFWYPGLLFKLENVWEGLSILIPVDAILGPILTLLLFTPGKRGLKLDLTLIAVFQLGALIYGGGMIYEQRPAVYAFVEDRVEIVVATAPYIPDIPLSRFGADSVEFPLFTYVKPPESRKAKSKFIVDWIQFSKLGDRHYPAKEHLAIMAESALDPSRIKPSSVKSKAAFLEFMKQGDGFRKDVLLLRLQGTTSESIVMAIDASTGELVELLEIDPWTEYSSVKASE